MKRRGEKEPALKAKSVPTSSERPERIEELREQLRDLEIPSCVKDQAIKNYKKDREAFDEERQRLHITANAQSHKMGVLETRLLQLDAPVVNKSLQRGSEGFGIIEQDTNSVGREEN